MVSLIGAIINCEPNNRSCWGPKTWKLLSNVCDLIPCDHCADHCRSMVSFEHDVLNAHLGKPIYDKGNVGNYLKTIQKAFPEKVVLIVPPTIR